MGPDRLDLPPEGRPPPRRARILGAVLGHAWLLQALLALALIALAVWQIDLHSLTRALVHVRPGWLAAAFAIYTGSRLLHTLEWDILLTKVGNVPFRGQFGVLLIGSLVNAVLPANLGDVAKLQIMANRYGLARAGIIGGRGAETVLNGVMFVVFVLIGVASAHGRAPQALILAIAAASGALCLGAVLLSRQMEKTAPRWPLMQRLPLKLRRKLEESWPHLHDGFEAIRRPRLLTILVLLNIAGWSIEIAMYWTYGQAFRLDIPFVAFISVAVVVSVVTTFPITFGNVGSWEVGIVAALALYNVPSDQALAYAAGSHVFITLFNLGLGLAAMLLMRVSPGEILSLRRRSDRAAAD